MQQYDSPEGIARLQTTMADLYHVRHAAVVTGDTLGDPFSEWGVLSHQLLIVMSSLIFDLLSVALINSIPLCVNLPLVIYCRGHFRPGAQR